LYYKELFEYVIARSGGDGSTAIPLLSKVQLSKMSREAHPIKAAERRQILAPGASPGSFG